MVEATGAQTGLTMVNRDQLFALVSAHGVPCTHSMNPCLMWGKLFICFDVLENPRIFYGIPLICCQLTVMLIGGKVHHYLPFRRTICKDKCVLNLLKGIHFPFERGPPTQRHIPHELKMTDDEKAFVDQEVHHLLETNCIKALPEMIPGGW